MAEVNQRPVGYECVSMKDDLKRLINIDYILIGKNFSWSILFSHEDGGLIDGPFYFSKVRITEQRHPPDHLEPGSR